MINLCSIAANQGSWRFVFGGESGESVCVRTAKAKKVSEL